MKWNILNMIWDEISYDQQWFAIGEAISHLRYLEEQGKVQRGTDDSYQVKFMCL